ncbi:MAG: glycosyltransferase family 2 protein [Acidobacteria bacterium]|nr:glycosyltransferase family 2 protein [Acidobacteriota bacterium]
MLNIVLPIAGRGSRFADAGYRLPKPLISVHGMPMIEAVVRNVRPSGPHRFIFVALGEHLDHLGMRETLERAAPGCLIVPVDRVTDGAACTVLLARDHIDTNDPLMLANSDQWVDVDIDRYLDELDRQRADGLIMTMTADDAKWSFVGLDARGFVTRVVEKQAISSDATVGIYNFRRGADFVRGADRMIAANRRVNGEFYVAPVYNELIGEGARVAVYNVGREGAGMYGLGIPSDLALFLSDPISTRAVA